ncbi:unnamed protein product [Urochloa humidicola]
MTRHRFVFSRALHNNRQQRGLGDPGIEKTPHTSRTHQLLDGMPHRNDVIHLALFPPRLLRPAPFPVSPPMGDAKRASSPRPAHDWFWVVQMQRFSACRSLL